MAANIDMKLVNDVVDRLKKQGVFDSFRKECFADVDTTPAYQNLNHRVLATVERFLLTQKWRPDLNKNQLRESLRRHLNESHMLSSGIDRVVDQVINPKFVEEVFKPQVDKAICGYLGLDYSRWLSMQNARKNAEEFRSQHDGCLQSNFLNTQMHLPPVLSVGVCPDNSLSMPNPSTYNMPPRMLAGGDAPPALSMPPPNLLELPRMAMVRPPPLNNVNICARFPPPPEILYSMPPPSQQNIITGYYPPGQVPCRELPNVPGFLPPMMPPYPPVEFSNVVAYKSTSDSGALDGTSNTQHHSNEFGNIREFEFDDRRYYSDTIGANSHALAPMHFRSEILVGMTDNVFCPNQPGTDMRDGERVESTNNTGSVSEDTRRDEETVVSDEHGNYDVRSKEYDFAWKTIDVDNLSISSVHTSDLSSFVESDEEEAENAAGSADTKPSENNICTTTQLDSIHEESVNSSQERRNAGNIEEDTAASDDDHVNPNAPTYRHAKLHMTDEKKKKRDELRRQRREKLENKKKKKKETSQLTESDKKAEMTLTTCGKTEPQPDDGMPLTNTQHQHGSTKKQLKEELRERKVLEKNRDRHRQNILKPKHLIPKTTKGVYEYMVQDIGESIEIEQFIDNEVEEFVEVDATENFDDYSRMAELEEFQDELEESQDEAT